MTHDDEINKLRSDIRSLDGRLRDRRPDPVLLPTELAGTVFDGGDIPESLPGVFSVHPDQVSGPDVSGSPITVAGSTGSTTVTVIGSKVPAVGDILLARKVGGRWVAQVGQPCTMLVKPRGPYGVPIVGAQVDLFWNHATLGAFLDPASNDSTQGPYTTTSTGVMIAIEDPANGIYMVRVVAAGYATTYSFVFACDGVCNPGGILGGTVPPGSTLVATGASITTNVQTSPLYRSNNSNLNPGFATISGTITGYSQPFSQFPEQTGGAFPCVDVIGGCGHTVNSTPGYIEVKCLPGGAGISVQARVGLVSCPPGNTVPTDYSLNALFYGVGSILGSKVTSIEYSPFKIKGTWDATYSRPYTLTDNGGGVSTTQPGTGLTPLTGDYTIQ